MFYMITFAVKAQVNADKLYQQAKNMYMKTNNYFIILLLLIFCQCEKNKKVETECERIVYELALSPGACFPEVSDKYVYPIVPGMAEWQGDVYSFCQLPDNVLKCISTPGLIDALVHAPLFYSWYNLSSDASALKWHAHYKKFNSAEEFFQREDAGDALVAYYTLICLDLDCIDTSYNKNEIKKPFELYELEISYRMMGLECLFTRHEAIYMGPNGMVSIPYPQILDKMSHAKKKEAVIAILTNYEKCGGDCWSFCVPMAHIMLADEYVPIVKYSQDYPEELNNTLQGFAFPSNPNQWDIIISFAKDFIN